MQDGRNRALHAIRSSFVTLPGEELILVQRKHWSTYIFPTLIVTTIGILAFVASIFAYALAPFLLILILSAFFLNSLFIATVILRSIIDWYFTLYVVTNRKITEVSYRPLSSRQVNEVMLDQVRCTEISTKVDGIVDEFLDIGDVTITFDRPTHTEEFVMSRIGDPKKVETYLHRTLSPSPAYSNFYPHQNGGTRENNGFFVKNKHGKNGHNKWRYIDEIPLQPRPKGGETIWNL